MRWPYQKVKTLEASGTSRPRGRRDLASAPVAGVASAVVISMPSGPLHALNRSAGSLASPSAVGGLDHAPGNLVQERLEPTQALLVGLVPLYCNILAAEIRPLDAGDHIIVGLAEIAGNFCCPILTADFMRRHLERISVERPTDTSHMLHVVAPGDKPGQSFPHIIDANVPVKGRT